MKKRNGFQLFVLWMIGICIAACLFACLPIKISDVNLAEAEMKLYNEWLYTFKLKHFNFNNELITRPPGVEQYLFNLVLPSEGGINLKTHCVYYQVPYKNLSGIIKVIEQKNESECPEVSSLIPWFELKEISELQVKLENFKLILNFKYKNKKTNWSFVLPNINNGFVHQKYQSIKVKKLFPELTILRINEDSFDINFNKYLGKLSDRFSRGSSIRCQQVNKDCKTIGEYRCDSCAYGWYEVVDFSCPQGGSKFCGQNHCGEKNEPACPRGSKVVSSEELGICQSDLTSVYNSDHTLVCQ